MHFPIAIVTPWQRFLNFAYNLSDLTAQRKKVLLLLNVNIYRLLFYISCFVCACVYFFFSGNLLWQNLWQDLERRGHVFFLPTRITITRTAPRWNQDLLHYSHYQGTNCCVFINFMGQKFNLNALSKIFEFSFKDSNDSSRTH